MNDTVVFCILLETSHTMARHCCGTPRMVNGGKKNQTEGKTHKVTRYAGICAFLYASMYVRMCVSIYSMYMQVKVNICICMFLCVQVAIYNIGFTYHVCMHACIPLHTSMK